MAERRPLVNIGGRVKELPAGDTLPGGGGGSQVVYPKTAVFTSSGTFTLPVTALPSVELLLVGGGAGISGFGTGIPAGATSVTDASTAVLASADGAFATRPGRGGGIAAARKGGSSTSPGNPAAAGLYGWGCGGGAAEWPTPGTGTSGSSAAAGSGDGGGGGAAMNTASTGGNGGGVITLHASLTPGGTYTHVIGAGGVGTTSTGGSGRVEYRYMDTVP